MYVKVSTTRFCLKSPFDLISNLETDSRFPKRSSAVLAAQKTPSGVTGSLAHTQRDFHVRARAGRADAAQGTNTKRQKVGVGPGGLT